MRTILFVFLLCSLASAQNHVTIRDASGNVLLAGYETIDPVSVSISPQTATILSGGTQQFSATVANSLNGAVTWTASLGTIDAAGNFTLSALTDSQAVITAASLSDPTKVAFATVTVKASFDGPAELPRVLLTTSVASTPSPGIVTQVLPGNLQTAVNAAQCGDTLELQAGATYTGNVNFPQKACDDQHWIAIRSNAASLPPEGTRFLPCYSGVAALPGRPAFVCPSGVQSSSAKLVAGNSTGPVIFANGANHYRFGPGLEITRPSGTGINYQMISATGAADKIIFDRVWLHGTANDESKTGLLLNGMTIAAFIDSYATDFHCISSVGSCTDAKVIGGGNSTLSGGPYKITGNFLEASGENLLFGGASATTTPHDIEIRHNHFFKPLTWMKGQAGFVGGPSGNPFIVKNLLELKNAIRVLIEGNVFEYSWGGYSQQGYGILLSPKNQSGGCPICKVTDVTVRYNTVAHTGAGIQISAFADAPGQYGTAFERYSIHDVILSDINKTLFNGSGVLFQIDNTWPTTSLNSLSINHVTGFPDPSALMISLSNLTTNPQMTGFTFTNNVIGPATYPVWSTTGVSTDCSISDRPLPAVSKCFAQYSFTNNVFAGVNLSSYPNSGSGNVWPGGNFFPASISLWPDFSLPTSSPYKASATDGSDPGANTAKVSAAIANVQ